MMYFNKRNNFTSEEDFGSEMMERIRKKFKENDVEGTGKIGMESFGIMVSDLDLVTEDDPEQKIEDAFEGIDMDDKEEIDFEEFMTIARRLNFKIREEKFKKRMADVTEGQILDVFNKHKTYNE